MYTGVSTFMQVGEPVFSLMWLSRKSLLLFGSGKGLGVLRKSGRQDLLHYIAWDCMYAESITCIYSKWQCLTYSESLLIFILWKVSC